MISQEFNVVIKNAQCIEMKMKKPWTYQVCYVIKNYVAYNEINIIIIIMNLYKYNFNF